MFDIYQTQTMGVTQSVALEHPEELPVSIIIPTPGRAPPPDFF